MGSPEKLSESILARRHQFSSAHLYKQEQFTEAENRREFGACFTPYGHGHNYVLEVFVAGPIDPVTKLVVNLAELDTVLKKSAEPLDHHHLNFDVPEFRSVIPTTENIALYLRQRVLAELGRYPQLRLTGLKLFETDELWVEIKE